jgi:hypothetical protein
MARGRSNVRYARYCGAARGGRRGMLRGDTGRLMNAQTSGFRAGCREQAGLAIVAFGRLWSWYAPGGRNRIPVRTGCLIFAPFITFTVAAAGGRLADGRDADPDLCPGNGRTGRRVLPGSAPEGAAL